MPISHVGIGFALRSLEEMTEPAEPLASHLGAVVLAAGQGTRMRSRLPKVLHPLAGQPMVAHVLDALAAVGVGEPVLVVGEQAREVRDVLGSRVRYAEQREPLGTGHAVLQAAEACEPAARRVLVLYGDTPLLTAATLERLIAAAQDATLVMVTAEVTDPAGYGRVVRDAAGAVRGLVEDREATDGQRAVCEVNVGAYVFDAAWLWAELPKLSPSASGECYLTDLVERAAAQGRHIATVRLADPNEGLGVNDRVQLALAEGIVRGRVRERLMRTGVTLVDPATTYVDATVEIAPDTVIHPHTFLRGRTRIGAGCEIGPSTHIEDTIVGDRCHVVWSMLEGAELADDVSVGPYSHVRPGGRLASGVSLGNYAEVKNSVLGENVQQHHFSYIGDAEIGRDSNIGCGTVTCNYDGVNKNRTEVGERVFIGSDTMLVAPVRLGDGAVTGAGAVVVRDVPPGKLAVGVPAKVVRDVTPVEPPPPDAPAVPAAAEPGSA